MKPMPRLVNLLAALVVLAMIAQAIWLSSYTVDDAFISFRYARNLIEGQGLVFNPGERVEGYTNFLWTIIMAAVVATGIDPVLAAKALGVAASTGTLLLVYRLSVATRPEASPWFLSIAAVAMLAANGAFATAAISGLETALFTFFVVAGASGVVLGTLTLTLSQRERGGDAVLSQLSASVPLFFALAALTRPEGVVVFGATVILKAMSRSLHIDDLRTCARWTLIFAAFYLPYFFWRLWYYGDFFPNTYYAKTGAGLAQYYKGILDLKAFSLTYFGIVFLLALIVLARRRSPFWLTYVTGMAVTFAAVSIYEGGDWIPFFRLLVPALPFYYLVIQEALRAVGRRQPVSRDNGAVRISPTATVGGLGLVTLALVAVMALPSPAMGEELARTARGQEVAHAELGRWLRERAQGPVALMDIGRVGYISRLPLVDTSGLTDRSIAHSVGGLIDKKFDLGYILDRAPRYFVLASTTDFIAKGAVPTDFPIEKRIYDDERFHQRYRHLFTLDSGWEVDGKGYFLMVYEQE